MRRWLACTAWLVGACTAPAPAVLPLPAEEEVSLDRATSDHVEGEVDGHAFVAADVRFRVRSGAEEHVDLWLADASIERCGLALPREGTRVWLRLPGRTTLETGVFEQTGDEDAPTLEAHYERALDRAFVEAHRARARLEITRATPELVEGRVRACFADDARSCVGGHFVARPCWSRVDGRALREPPGLADDALAPRPSP